MTLEAKSNDPAQIRQLISSILRDELGRQAILKIESRQWEQMRRLLAENPARQTIYFILKRKDCLEALPLEIKEKWQVTYYHNLKRNILGIEQLREIQAALGESGVRFILLKGLSLISIVYADLGARSSVDIDLLVRKEQLKEVRYQLERLDYHLQSCARTELLESFGCGDWVFTRKGFMPLDIHWELCQYERFRGILKFNEQQIFEDAAPINIDNISLFGLAKEDLFLYLSMHLGLVHKFTGIHWLYDLKAIIERYQEDFNWDLLVKKARRARLATVLYYALILCQERLGVILPQKVIDRIKPSFIKRTLLGLSMSKVDVLGLKQTGSRRKIAYLVQALLMDGMVESGRIIGKMLFPSREWLAYHYDNSDKKDLRHSYQWRHIHNALFHSR